MQRPGGVAPAVETNIGIHHHDDYNTWHAQVHDPSAQLGQHWVNLGGYNTSDEARRSYDRAAIKLLGGMEGLGPYKLNFPESDYAEYFRKHSDWSTRDFIWKLKTEAVTFSRGNSSMKGVRMIRKPVSTRARRINVPRCTYHMSIGFTDSHGKHCRHQAGGFPNEVEAGRAYDRALLALKGDDASAITNFRPSSYSEAEIQDVRQQLAMKFPNYFDSAGNVTMGSTDRV